MILPMTSRRFLSKYRLRHRADFARVYDRRASASDALLLVYVCENTLGHARLGLSVSRKVGQATMRNRWKRILREAFRLSHDKLPGGIDIVVVPRPGGQPQLPSVIESVLRLTKRAAKRLSRE